MANKRYVCAQACQLGGKRYEAGEPLADGVEPNSHFKDTKTGEMVKSKQPEPMAVPAAENQTAAEIKAQFEDFKVLVGEHLAKFDKRISALEKALAETKKAEPESKAKAKGGNKSKEPEQETEQTEGNDNTPGNNEQPVNPSPDAPLNN